MYDDGFYFHGVEVERDHLEGCVGTPSTVKLGYDSSSPLMISANSISRESMCFLIEIAEPTKMRVNKMANVSIPIGKPESA